MEFFIKKGATLPLLKMDVIQDGRSDYMSFMEEIDTYSIFFTMYNESNGIQKIIAEPANIVAKTNLAEGAPPEYYIFYKFTETNTDTPGRYVGEFMLTNSTGKLILPLRDVLHINIVDSFSERKKCC